MSLSPKIRKVEEYLSRIHYSPDDGTLIWLSGPRSGKECGWVDQHGYRLVRLGEHLVRCHHLVWFIETGVWPSYEVDHVDNKPGNNRFENLRLANRNQQGSNQKLQKRRKGKWKGVHISSSGKHYVKIKHEGKSIRGLPANVECAREAAMIYNLKAEEIFGPYANFNKVFEDEKL